MSIYGTQPLDPEVYPKEIVVSDRVKATLIHNTYHVDFPFDREAIQVAKDYGMHYQRGGWCKSYHGVEGVRKAMEEIESILADKDPKPPERTDDELSL